MVVHVPVSLISTGVLVSTQRKDAARPKSGVHEFGQFGQKVELLSFPTVVSDCKSDDY